MRQRACVAALAATVAASVVGGCTSHTSSSRPERSAVDSKSVPGLLLDLQEIGDGESVPHPPDDAWRDHLQEVDKRSTLRLTFHAPRGLAPVAASPEWQRLELAVARLNEGLEEYRTLAGELAERTARRGADVAGYDARVEAFERRQRALVASLADATRESMQGTAPLTREELAIVAADPDGPWAGLAKWVAQQLADLSARARATVAARDDVLVTVRARLQPTVGLEQWLQVPGYWEKRGDLPASDTTRRCSGETEQLRVEYDAAQRLAAAVQELRRTGDGIAGDLRRSVESTRDRMVTRLRDLADGRGRALTALLAHAPQPRDGLPPAEREFWEALAKLSGELDAALAEWRGLAAAAATRPPREQLAECVRALDALERRRAAIEAAVAALAANGSAALAAAPDDQKPAIASLQHDLATSWPASLAALFAAPAETKGALAAARPLVEAGAPLLAGVDRLPADAANAIARPPGELPPVDLDLRRQPVDSGDRLKLEVAFYDRDEFANAQAQGREAEPLETIRYTNLAMQSGWKWSGDLIFTQQLSGANHDFSSTAAVSYEHHWRDRDDPRGFANLIDPGVGFHAAALNFDPDVTAEFGMGVNASLLGGLIRAGVGYDVSISRDREYWFIGFGLVTTLEAVESVGEKAFGF